MKLPSIYLCLHKAGEGLFVEIDSTIVQVQVDSNRKIDESTAMYICRAIGEPWPMVAHRCRKYYVNQCGCGQYFMANHHQKKYCSVECVAKIASQRQDEYRNTAKAKRIEKTHCLKCIYCGVKIEGVRLSKHFCSAKCRQRGSRKWR